MRPLYFLLKFLLKFTLWVYYPRLININKPKKRFARTIFASNHPASFMDPLVIASSQKPIVFFMTRSDVFTALLKPILWASHMLPIYRQHDGEDTKAKNEAVFRKCYRILRWGRNLLMFAEGFTDDVFIRRLKPVKKGAVRIGFGALQADNWEHPVYIQAVGINYSDPNSVGSDVVVSNSEPICLNDYREEFEENEVRTIVKLSSEVEQRMRDQIVDVRDKKMAPVHEMVMRFTRKGMNAVDSDKGIPLIERWKYAKRLAQWFNEMNEEQKSKIHDLQVLMATYFDKQKELGIEENDFYHVNKNSWNRTIDLIFLVCLFPVMFIGTFFNVIPYLFIKRFVEKSFKRSVFWGSVKMLLGLVAAGLYNLITLFVGVFFIYHSWPLWLFVYFIVIPLSGVIAYNWFKRLKRVNHRSSMFTKDLGDLGAQRERIIQEIGNIIPVA
jgi:hypothetical protein